MKLAVIVGVILAWVSSTAVSCCNRSPKDRFSRDLAHPLYPMIQPNVYIEELIQNTTSRARMDSTSAWYVCTELANNWPFYVGKRVDEGSIYDCPGTSPGGQCVALLKVKCGLPYTGYWHAAKKLSEGCEQLTFGTALATFDSQNSPYKNRDGPLVYDHAAMFMSCNSTGVTELMNKVLHDQPDDPLVYLIRMLYRKAALPVPKDLKPGTLRRSSPERHGRRSPDKTSTQAWAVASGPDLVDRSYDKPWQTQSKKPKSRDKEKMEGTKAGRKQKQGWVSDTKLTTTTFDDLFEEDQRHEDTVKHHGREDKTDIRKAWATNVGVMDGEDANYRSRGYTGPRCQRDNEDPLAGEIMLSETVVTKEESPAVESSSHKKGHKMDSLKHREELGKLLTDTDKSSTVSGDSGMYESDENEDDAIELLEDPDDLRREGVTKISKTGYKLSRVLRQREQEQHNVKLNINLFTGNAPANSQLGSEYDYYDSDLERPQTGMSFQQSDYSPGISDDEFESVSQVVGPRHPVWGARDYDDENVPKFSRTLPEPSRQQQRSGKLASTIPVRFQEQPNLIRSEDTNVFLKGGKPWDPKMYSSQDEPMVESRPPPAPAQVRDSVRSERSAQSPIGVEGGWHIPDDTEVSLATEWTAQSSGRPDNGPPKAY